MDRSRILLVIFFVFFAVVLFNINKNISKDIEEGSRITTPSFPAPNPETLQKQEKVVNQLPAEVLEEDVKAPAAAVVSSPPPEEKSKIYELPLENTILVQ